jgi:transposase
VIEAVETGASRGEAAESFGIDASSAVRWLQCWNETGRCAPKPRGGSVSPLERHAEQILALVAEQSDLTLEEAIAELRKRRIRTSKSAVSRFFQRHEITFKKKSLRAAEQHRADVARARRRWIREQGMLDPARLVFIDETAVTTKMVRLWGRGPRGLELIRRAPCGEWTMITFVAALRHNKMVAPMVVDGAMNAETFLAYVEQCLVPTLKHGDIVVMDNVSVHKSPRIREAIENARATLRYLPQYSPDLNPIEMPFSKFKAFLRRAAERTIPGLRRAIRSFLPGLRARECANYFRHAGYTAI